MAEDGRKMSKSFGNVVDPQEIVKEFGPDALKYFFIKEFTIENDNSFSRSKFIEVYNNDLVNTYGNLVTRFVGMCKKYTNSTISKTTIENPLSIKLVELQNECIKNIKERIDAFDIRSVMENIFTLAQAANKYVEENKP
jgi:methionyl-tRNA synthetase